MSAFTANNNRREAPPKVLPIIIAADQADARAYAERHGETTHIAVTPRSMVHARGRLGPVYATRKARLHPRYADMLQDARPCGLLIPRKPRDRRVA